MSRRSKAAESVIAARVAKREVMQASKNLPSVKDRFSALAEDEEWENEDEDEGLRGQR